MERLVKGDIIVLEFPFSDLKLYKRRPSLIIKVPKGEDIIICQITAESQEKEAEIPLTSMEFAKGGLKRNSYIRMDKIATIKKTRIKYKIGSLKPERFTEIADKIVHYLRE